MAAVVTQQSQKEKMSWRKFKEMLRDKETMRKAENYEPNEEHKPQPKSQKRQSTSKTPTPEQNKSHNNNQAVVAKNGIPPRKKMNVNDLVSMHLAQSKAFGQTKKQPLQVTGAVTGAPPPKKRSPSPIRAKPEPQTVVPQKPAKTSEAMKAPKSKSKKAANQDIPIIWYTKDSEAQPPGKSTAKAPVKQKKSKQDNRPHIDNKQPTTKNEGSQKPKEKKAWSKLARQQLDHNEEHKPAPQQQRSHSPQRDPSPEMPPQRHKGYPTKPGASKAPKKKNGNIEDKRRKFLKRITDQKPKKSDWKNAESRKPKRRLSEEEEEENGITDLYAFKPRTPLVVDRNDRYGPNPNEHSQPKRSRSRSPAKHHEGQHERRSRSQSPAKPSPGQKPKRSRSQSPQKRVFEVAPPPTRQSQPVTVERTIPRVVRITDEYGHQQVVIEKTERVELFKGKYPNYLRNGDRPKLKKKRHLQRPQMQNTAPVSYPEGQLVRPRPQFDRNAYRNEKYEAALHQRRLAQMGMTGEEEFFNHHGHENMQGGHVHHGGRNGTFYTRHQDYDQYSRGRVSSLSNVQESASRPRVVRQQQQRYHDQDLLPAEDGVEVRYDDGYEIYRNRYPNYLRQARWKKAVPLRIQQVQEPESDEEPIPPPRRHQPEREEDSPPPPLPTDEDSDSQENGFRHKRELRSTSPRRDILLNLKSPAASQDEKAGDSGVDSEHKTPDMRSETPKPRPLIRQQSRQHTELLDEEEEQENKPSGEIPEVLQSLLSSQSEAFVTQQQTNRILTQQSEMFGRSTSEMDHATWQRYSISKAEGIAAVVKCPKSVLPETKDSLVFEDSLPASIQGRLPALPFMEFEDWDGNVRMSPMKLTWESRKGKGKPMQSGIYLALPIHSDFYNEVLQHLLFLYTSDLQEWHQVEGKLISLTIEGEKYDFIEVYLEEPFRFLIFDVKVRYREDINTIMPGGGELESQMEHGIRVEVKSRTFDRPAKMKLKVEPLDMNETDIRQLVPSIHAVHAVAVSPIVKLATSEPMKQAVSIYVPKPGHAVFGSVKMGVRGRMTDLKNLRVHLLTKEKEVQRFTAAATLKRELAKELEFQVRIWKYGGKCYCLLVLEGLESIGPGMSEYGMSSAPPSNAAGFLSNVLMKQIALEMSYDDVQLRNLGRQLLNSTTANTIIDQHPDNIEMAMFKILRRWKNQNKKMADSILTRRLITALRESGLKQEAAIIKQKYEEHMTGSERNTILAVFDELKACPSVLVNWKLLAKYLGLSPDEMNATDLKVENPADIRRTCSKMLKKVFEKLEGNTEYYRDILMTYIHALEQIGCHKIAGSIEKRHIDKFYVNPV